MPLALTCTCGARLEIDDKFAGQMINCPDCQAALQAPVSETAGQRTSGLALVSIIMALVGAFTIVGTVVAMAVGALALVQIGRSSGRVAGRGYAIAGIVIGVVMTAGTVFALTRIELFGLSGMLSEANWTGKLDFPDQLEVVRDRDGFAISRPSQKWGIYKPPPRANNDGDLIHSAWDELLLVLPSDDAVILCYAAPVDPGDSIEQCQARFEREFRDIGNDMLFGKGGKGRAPDFGSTRVKNVKAEKPQRKGNIDMVDMKIDKTKGGEEKTFVVRIIKRDRDNRMFVAICGVRPTRLPHLKSQFDEALASFRLLGPR